MVFFWRCCIDEPHQSHVGSSHVIHDLGDPFEHGVFKQEYLDSYSKDLSYHKICPNLKRLMS